MSVPLIIYVVPLFTYMVVYNVLTNKHVGLDVYNVLTNKHVGLYVYSVLTNKHVGLDVSFLISSLFYLADYFIAHKKHDQHPFWILNQLYRIMIYIPLLTEQDSNKHMYTHFLSLILSHNHAWKAFHHIHYNLFSNAAINNL